MSGLKPQFLAFLCGLCSVVIYYFHWNHTVVPSEINNNISDHVEAIGSRLKAEFGFVTLLSCDIVDSITIESGDFSCSIERLAVDASWVCSTFCILWKEYPNLLALVSVRLV